MLDETQQQSLVTRLNRIEGQVRGIRRMVQDALKRAACPSKNVSPSSWTFSIASLVSSAVSAGRLSRQDPFRSRSGPEMF